jgi:hypothetical protein
MQLRQTKKLVLFDKLTILKGVVTNLEHLYSVLLERSRARCNCLIQNCFHECSQMLLLKYYAVKFYSFRAIGKVPACSRFWTSGTYVQSAVLNRAATRRELIRFGNQRHLPLQHLKSTRQERVFKDRRKALALPQKWTSIFSSLHTLCYFAAMLDLIETGDIALLSNATTT